jgi:hypothetical protein
VNWRGDFTTFTSKRLPGSHGPAFSLTDILSANFIVFEPVRVRRAQTAQKVCFPAQDGVGKRDTKSGAAVSTAAGFL